MALQPQLVQGMLRDLKEQSLNLLDEALRHAIVNDRLEIAVNALDLGASVAAYNIEGQPTSAGNAAGSNKLGSDVKVSGDQVLYLNCAPSRFVVRPLPSFTVSI